MTVASTIESEYVPTPLPTAELVPVEDNATILVDQASGNAQVLNATGALMWQCFDGESTVGDIAVDVADVFEITFDEALDGLGAMVENLQTARMLRGDDTAEDVALADPELGRTKYLDVRPSG
jgi:hypothetical protein